MGEGSARPNPVEPQEASTILLVRDASAGPGIEVLLVRRRAELAFAGGALVFPGGKVEDTDRTLEPDRWAGPPLTYWQTVLGLEEPTRALSYVVAAIRETFEETGLLLATRADGRQLCATDLQSESTQAARTLLNRRAHTWDWRHWLADENLILDTAAIAYWSWWVTPSRLPKRFDTRFFIAEAPHYQTAQHDGTEITTLVWSRPEDVLRDHGSDGTLMYPTRCNLSDLAGYPDASTAVRAARMRPVDRCRLWPRPSAP